MFVAGVSLPVWGSWTVRVVTAPVTGTAFWLELHTADFGPMDFR